MNKIFLLFVLSITLLVGLIWFYPTPTAVVYDCRISEISPDVPVSVKEECRLLMGKKK